MVQNSLRGRIVNRFLLPKVRAAEEISMKTLLVVGLWGESYWIVARLMHYAFHGKGVIGGLMFPWDQPGRFFYSRPTTTLVALVFSFLILRAKDGPSASFQLRTSRVPVCVLMIAIVVAIWWSIIQHIEVDLILMCRSER